MIHTKHEISLLNLESTGISSQQLPQLHDFSTASPILAKLSDDFRRGSHKFLYPPEVHTYTVNGFVRGDKVDTFMMAVLMFKALFK
jgi:hypothetical protein